MTLIIEMLSVLTELMPFLNIGAFLVLFGVIVVLLLEKFLDVWHLRRGFVIEQKKMWASHVERNLNVLEALEFELLRFSAILKQMQNYQDLKRYNEVFVETQYSKNLQLSTPSLEMLASGYYIEFYTVLLPMFREHIQTRMAQEENNGKDIVWESFLQLVDLLVAFTNAVRLKLSFSFYGKDTIGHVMIRAQLLKIVQECCFDGQKIGPGKAKQFLKREKNYEMILSAIHPRYLKHKEQFLTHCRKK